jgi:hypothetical protein
MDQQATIENLRWSSQVYLWLAIGIPILGAIVGGLLNTVVLEKNNMSYPGSRAGTSSSFTRCCMSWRPRGSGCTGYQR